MGGGGCVVGYLLSRSCLREGVNLAMWPYHLPYPLPRPQARSGPVCLELGAGGFGRYCLVMLMRGCLIYSMIPQHKSNQF